MVIIVFSEFTYTIIIFKPSLNLRLNTLITKDDFHSQAFVTSKFPNTGTELTKSYSE